MYKIHLMKVSIYELSPNEDAKIPFKIQATSTGKIYFSVESMTDEGEPLFLESPTQSIRVKKIPPEIKFMFALTEPCFFSISFFFSLDS